MRYVVKSEILGFESIGEVDFEEIDPLFASIKDVDNPNISFTLVNPFALRDYAFDIPAYIYALLDMKKDSKLLIYNIAVLQTPTKETKVNFLAPIIMNQENGTLAQALLKKEDYRDFGMAEPIKDFIKE